MKKILHMTPPDINNGVYRYIFNHMCYMDRQNYSFAFWTKGAEALRKTSEYEKYGFEVYELRGTQRENKDDFRREIIEILSYGFDIIHLHTSSWRGFLIEEVAMEFPVTRVIVHSHSTGIDVEEEMERVERIRIHEEYRKQFSMNYATDVWACSRLAAKWLYGTSIPMGQVQILPNAIDTRRYLYDSVKRDILRKKMNLEGRFVIGNIGRYTYQKNQEFLIDVAKELHRKGVQAYVLCLGEGELLPKLQKQIQTYGLTKDVCCMEWQEHSEDYLQVMDVFCLPSRFEGLPISAVEAQTAGLPCLISDTITEEVKLTDLVRFLPLDKEIWTEVLLEFIGKNGKEQRKNQAKTVAKAGYDIRGAAKRLERLYEGDAGMY